MATRCNIIIKRGEDEILIYRHSDGHPPVTGVDLLKICQKSNYDVFGIIQSMAKDGQYELTQCKHGDAEYEYSIDIDKKEITALQILSGIWIKSDEFESILNIDGVSEQELLSILEGNVDMHQEWHQRFPVNMDNPVALTAEQKERALKIYEAISAHMDAYPDEENAPLICITQDWRIRVDLGGWNCASDLGQNGF